MDFFARQDAARSASFRLAIAMVVAVAAVVIAVDLAALVIFDLGRQWTAHPGLERPDASEHAARVAHQAIVWLSVGAVVVVAGGALMAWVGISGGGRAVAESLGGREVLHATADEDGKRLLNVVEEMALASGVPCPPVFVIDDERINACAAGFSPADAAVAVTRGCLRQLSRDELQGVIGHEFSHILNGDMRLNMRLAAAVAGLLAIAGIGRFVFQAAANSSSGNRDRKGGGALPFILFGLALIAIGWVGWIAGRLIQAAFSRQREFLADASAVQFTRNPGGIAGALARIRGGGSAVSSPRAAGLAHLFFADAIADRLVGLFATHPPLGERIARITGTPVEAVAGAGDGMAALPAAAMGFAGAAAPMRATGVARLAGAVSPERVRFGAALLARLPAALAQAAREPASARAVVLLPLLHQQRDERDRQIAWLHARDPWLANEVRRLEDAWDRLDQDAARLPLLQLAAPALGAMSPRQRAELLAIAEAIARLDAVLTMREFCVLRRLQLALSPARPATASRIRLREAAADATVLLGTLAHAAGGDPAARAGAFAAGWARLPLPGAAPALPGAAACAPLALGAALDRLAGLDAAGLRALVDACAHAVAADGTVNAREAELLRLACDALGVPLPAFADPA